MPYVQVWIDDADCDCDCDEAEHLQRQVDEAIRLLEANEAEAALAALREDCHTFLSPAEIKIKYLRWKEGTLPGFTTYRGAQ